QIEREWHPVCRVDPFQACADQPIGKQAEVATARDGHLEVADSRRGHRKLHDRSPAGGGDASGSPLGSRHAVPVVNYREDRGIVFEAKVQQRVERPARLRGDREARRSVTEDRLANEVLEKLFSAGGFLEKNLRGLLVNELM